MVFINQLQLELWRVMDNEILWLKALFVIKTMFPLKYIDSKPACAISKVLETFIFRWSQFCLYTCIRFEFIL